MTALYDFDRDADLDVDPIYECDRKLEAARDHITSAISGRVSRHDGIAWAFQLLTAAHGHIDGIEA